MAGNVGSLSLKVSPSRHRDDRAAKLANNALIDLSFNVKAVRIGNSASCFAFPEVPISTTKETRALRTFGNSLFLTSGSSPWVAILLRRDSGRHRATREIRRRRGSERAL